ncbi:unnamed protein product [Dicrocoelium dendriticum]|nr:unnamed protein product [Dicrocoelium dendriticum]
MSHNLSYFLSLAFIGITLSAVSKPPQDAKRPRVADDDLSKAPHEIHGVHNPKYDQDALFGEDAKRFDDMTPEQGLEHLGNIFDKIDQDHDGYVTPDELRDWLKKVHQHVNVADAKRNWERYNLSSTDMLSWDTFVRHTGDDEDYEDDEGTRSSYLARDRRRWDVADTNGDGLLSHEEAASFFNPESDPRMHSTIAKETIEELDKNNNSAIDLDEFIADLWKPVPGEPEPDWVASERQDFIERRDIDHDGLLNEEEVRNWLFPEDYDRSEAEVQHLMSECDVDRDGQLTKAEIQARYDLLVGSAVTNYGEILSDHDEL